MKKKNRNCDAVYIYFGMESCDAVDAVDGVNVNDPKCVCACGIQLN